MRSDKERMTSIFLKFQIVYKFVVMFLILMAAFVFFQYGLQIAKAYSAKLNQENKLLEAELDGIYKVPELESLLSNLEERVRILNTKEINGRLSKIEKSLEIADLDFDQIKSIKQLREDYEKIQSYVFQNPDQVIEVKQLQRDYIEIKARQEKFMEKDDIEREFNFDRILLTSALGVFGILATIFGVSWFSMWRKSNNEIKSNTSESKENNDVS